MQITFLIRIINKKKALFSKLKEKIYINYKRGMYDGIIL